MKTKVKRIEISVVDKCNQGCSYCHQKSRMSEYNFSELVAPCDIDKLNKVFDRYEAEEIAIIGPGETSLLENFEEVVELCASQESTNLITIISNCTGRSIDWYKEFIATHKKKYPTKKLNFGLSLHLESDNYENVKDLAETYPDDTYVMTVVNNGLLPAFLSLYEEDEEFVRRMRVNCDINCGDKGAMLKKEFKSRGLSIDLICEEVIRGGYCICHNDCVILKKIGQKYILDRIRDNFSNFAREI